MKRELLIGLMAAGVLTALAVTTGVLRTGGVKGAERVTVIGERHAPFRRVAGPQPDTSSPDWKALSDDVGVLIRDDERLGLRGRLFVRVDGVWWPVAADGPGDIVGAVPVK